MSKKLRDKQQRRLADEARKAQARKQHQKANLITIGIVVVVALAVAVGVFAAQSEENNPSVGVAASEAGCGQRVTFASEGNQHVPVGTQVDYKHNPPTTGDHWPPEAIAAHLRSDILLLDEVLAVGDMDFRKRCLDKMSEVASSGRTVIFVSHNMATVQNICNRVIWISEGRIEADGDPEIAIAAYKESNQATGTHASGVLLADATA